MPGSLGLLVNGETIRIEVDARRTLLSVLRDDLGLTGAKYGCGEGVCGACTVLVGGRPVRSCTIRAGDAKGKRITTIEGLERNGALHPIQQAFLKVDALECGYCTPGMILTALALLDSNPDPSEREIVHHMEGNICRCGVYRAIIAAVREAARTMRERRA